MSTYCNPRRWPKCSSYTTPGHRQATQLLSNQEDASHGVLYKDKPWVTFPNLGLTSNVSTLDKKFVQILHHSEKKYPCFRVFSVGHDVIDRETMNDSVHSLLKIGERIKVTTKHNRVLHSEHRMRSIGFHNPIPWFR